jgi:hypothetical protein
VGFSILEDSPGTHSEGNLALDVIPDPETAEKERHRAAVPQQMEQDVAWRGELSQRLKAYRTRRGKFTSNVGQARFSFDGPPEKTVQNASLSLEELPASTEDDFSFTIAIGRPSKKKVLEESRMVIDVSLQPETGNDAQPKHSVEQFNSQPGIYPVASMTAGSPQSSIFVVCYSLTADSWCYSGHSEGISP